MVEPGHGRTQVLAGHAHTANATRARDLVNDEDKGFSVERELVTEVWSATLLERNLFVER